MKREKKNAKNHWHRKGDFMKAEINVSLTEMIGDYRVTLQIVNSHIYPLSSTPIPIAREKWLIDNKEIIPCYEREIADRSNELLNLKARALEQFESSLGNNIILPINETMKLRYNAWQEYKNLISERKTIKEYIIGGLGNSRDQKWLHKELVKRGYRITYTTLNRQINDGKVEFDLMVEISIILDLDLNKIKNNYKRTKR